MKLSKKPQACETIDEIREAIDQLDLEIIQLFRSGMNMLRRL